MSGQQLPLAIQIPLNATFEAFVAGDNRLLVELLQQAAEGQGERQVYFWAGQSIGKTHLLQACCHRAAAQDYSS